MVESLKYSCRKYGPHELQRVGIWEYENPDQKPEDGYWVVYIHGGAWRDPRVDHLSFIPIMHHLLVHQKAPPKNIAGFASIDYRLSPHPDFPQDPDNTPDTSLRNAKHPDHIEDIDTALNLLNGEYFTPDFHILIGHSAGATLAFQLVMELYPSSGILPPAAIVGVSGIYDLVALDNRHGGNYAGFISSAFGSDRKDWDAASPVHYTGTFGDAWSKPLILVWSPEDTLIDEPEIDAMAHRLIKDRAQVSVHKDFTGDHDQVWEKGSQLAHLISLLLHQLQGDFVR